MNHKIATSNADTELPTPEWVFKSQPIKYMYQDQTCTYVVIMSEWLPSLEFKETLVENL